MEDQAEKYLLIISLGSTPDVFRTTIKSFKQDLPNIEFSEIIIVCNTNLKTGELKKILAETIDNAGLNFDRTEIKKVYSKSDDLLSKSDNLDFFKMVLKELEDAKKKNFKVIVNIAGGRKQMSALLLAAAYLSGAETIYHTHHKPAKDQNSTEKVGLIEIPHLRLDKILQTIVKELDKENRYNGSISRLIEHLQTEETFKQLNRYFDEQSRYKFLKEEFEKRRPMYEAILQNSNIIVRNILQDNLMFQPQYQSRIKRFESFYDKILKKEDKEGRIIADPFERFNDNAGLRVIFYNSDDLDKAVKLVEESGDFLNFKDGKKLKGDNKFVEFGYRAVHLDAVLNPTKRCRLSEYRKLKGIPCEMQFTTVFAHAWSKVYHSLSYKDNRRVELSPTESMELDGDFKKAAEQLKSIEEIITKLTKKFYPNQNK